MKTKIFFLVMAIVYFSSANAQYLPLVEEDKYWILLVNFGSDFPNAASGHLLHFEGDTLIDNQFYKKVIKQELEGSHPCPPQEQPCFSIDRPYNTFSRGTLGFIREEVDFQKVYFLPLSQQYCKTEEFLLFDFSKQKNDTLNDCLRTAIGKNPDNDFGIVDSLTNEFLFGRQRNILNTNGSVTYIGLPFEGNIKIAEGFGFENYGPFHRFNNLDGLVDFCEGNCEILSSTKSSEDDFFIKIFPNPTSSILKIESELEIQEIEILDFTGRHVLILQNVEQVNVGNFPNGIYQVRIKSKYPDSFSVSKRFYISD